MFYHSYNYFMISNEKTEKIIKAFYEVYNELGYGFMEKVYENSLVIMLEKYGFKVEQQKEVSVFFEGILVGEYYADIIVDKEIILELKSTELLNESNKYQLLNYLRATGYKLGLLLNFGKNPEIKRVINNKSEE